MSFGICDKCGGTCDPNRDYCDGCAQRIDKEYEEWLKEREEKENKGKLTPSPGETNI